MYLPIPRTWAKKVAIVLIAIGILMMPDIIAPTPFMDLLINVPLAFLLADLLTLSYLQAFVLTYILSFMLVMAGLLVYPYNTKRLINGRFKASLRFIKSRPDIFILCLVGLVIVYFAGQYMYDTLWAAAKVELVKLGLI